MSTQILQHPGDLEHKLKVVQARMGLPTFIARDTEWPISLEELRDYENETLVVIVTVVPAPLGSAQYEEYKTRFQDVLAEQQIGHGYGHVHLEVAPTLKDELAPFMTSGYNHRKKVGVSILRFFHSNPIFNPKKAGYKGMWSAGSPFQMLKKTPDVVVSQLLPPGFIPQGRWLSAEPWNRYLRVDQPPGECIVCKGESKETIHFGHVTWGPDPYPVGLLCRACLEDTFKQWLNLLR